MKHSYRWLFVIPVMACLTLQSVGHAYVWGGYRWPIRQVPYYINPGNADVSEAAAITALQTGAGVWSMQSNADFSFYYMGRTSGSILTANGKNEVFFRNGSNGGLVAETMRWYDGAGNLIDADIVFYDGAWQFFTGSSGCSGGVYLEDVAAHEFGHALGLKHSSVPSATMYSTAVNCSTSWRILDPDDIAGVESIYPSTGGGSEPATNTSPGVSIYSPLNTSVLPASTAVSFLGSASDKEDGDLTSRISWTSNIDGALGTGGSFARTLTAGTHRITAQVSDSGGLSASRAVEVTVTASTTDASPPTSSLSLWASGYKIKGSQRVNLTWSGATSPSVDVYRNGSLVLTTANDGAETAATGKRGGGSYQYRVCESGTSVCSNTVTVAF